MVFLDCFGLDVEVFDVWCEEVVFVLFVLVKLEVCKVNCEFWVMVF